MTRRFYSNTVRSIGSLLPADVLAKAMAGEGLEGLRDSDYGLARGERLRDVVNDAFNEARSLWWAFQAEMRELPDSDRTATTLTRERWLLPLLRLLGFDEVQAESKAKTISGTEYAISHSWNRVPLHLMGARVELDRRDPGIPGAARLSPHSLLQQYLNRSEQHLWGIVTNGRRLRILRDSMSLTRQAYVEFDLEALFNGDVFPDFVLLYRVAHASRFRGERPHDCLLEAWIASARDEGIRALDQLRDGVESALVELGTGFLRHPANAGLKAMLDEGALTAEDIYRFLLRLVYRLLFLFVSEDRGLLLVPDADEVARDRFERYYSTNRLRELSALPIAPGNGDLWESLKVLMDLLSRDRGEPNLSLPGLGSFLWDPTTIGPLNNAALDNQVLAKAVRDLSTVSDGNVLRRIDFAGLGSEELGSVYETLLELHPSIDTVTMTFRLEVGAGSERKTTGSYYTPGELIAELLDSALDPVLERAASDPQDPEKAILSLKVLDPAAGSGHFLVAAAHRIAKRLAEVRTGEPEPPEPAYKAALRDVVSRCLFAVDVNELAVELCKVSLWLEALEPGKPLSFLDHHILHGNSLLGATPAAIERGIPNEAFVALTDDDKQWVKSLRNRNRQERTGQRRLGLGDSTIARVPDEILGLDGSHDSTIEAIHAKEAAMASWKESPAYRHALLVADAWCSAFFLEKKPDVPVLTEDAYRRLCDEGAIEPALEAEIQRIAEDNVFFHWHLEFPQVFSASSANETDTGWAGGFDVVLGNPPWERVKLQEKEFFATRRPDIAQAPNKAARDRLIRQLPDEDPDLWRGYRSALHGADAVSHFLRRSGIYPLAGRGDVNTYAVFAELMRNLISPSGRIGVILPTGIATDATTQHFFADLIDKKSLVGLYDFENRRAIFPAIHRSYKFSLVTLTGPGDPAEEAEFCFYSETASDLSDSERKFVLSAEDFALLNPNTRTCPVFRTRTDAAIVKKMYRQHPVLRCDNDAANSDWDVVIRRAFNHSTSQVLDLCETHPNTVCWPSGLVPMYEAKMFHSFDHRFATYVVRSSEDVDPVIEYDDDRDPAHIVWPRRFISVGEVEGRWVTTRRWTVAWRDICRANDERTVIATALPRVASDFTVRLYQSDTPSDRELLAFLAILNSFVFDYVARNKLGGTHLADYIFEQLPIPTRRDLGTALPPIGNTTAVEWLATRSLELVYTSWDLFEAFGSEAGSGPFRWDARRRRIIVAEINGLVAWLYGLAREELEWILESFPIVQRKEEAMSGSYQLKELILTVYDKLQRASTGGTEFRTLLEPPPGDSSLRVKSESA